ncbi:tail tube [Synechococcus phage Bellamy]|uniref:Tail tube n=1 Tax=Synechococcus phage Bellamy TaxID=2023996 RepID=A0A222YWT6_9CAUD|nr:tail tube [Synechococcus phage Bellamy]ASR76172.1 tail tube [Synechococcus phage Bellamy]
MAASKENRTISQFKSRLAGGGARPNLFEVELTLDGEGLGFSLPGYDATQMAFLCKAANLPAQNIASIDVPFRGRIFKVAGDRTIDTWTITIINDEDFRLRRAMEFWTEQIASLDTNLGATSPNAYMAAAKVYQLGRGSSPRSTDNSGDSNSVLAEYEFVDIFPTEVSAIDLSYDSSDTIEEFTVTFQVQSIRILKGEGAAGSARQNVNG